MHHFHIPPGGGGGGGAPKDNKKREIWLRRTGTNFEFNLKTSSLYKPRGVIAYLQGEEEVLKELTCSKITKSTLKIKYIPPGGGGGGGGGIEPFTQKKLFCFSLNLFLTSYYLLIASNPLLNNTKAKQKHAKVQKQFPGHPGSHEIR